MNLTINQIISWGPCADWPKKNMEAIFFGRASLSLLEILQDDTIPINDRIWIGCGALPEIRWWFSNRIRLFVATILNTVGLPGRAEIVLALPEIVSIDTAITTKASIISDLESAWAAVRVVSGSAAWSIRDVETPRLVRDAWYASTAAERAAHDAALVAGDDSFSAETTERKAQLNKLIELAKDLV